MNFPLFPLSIYDLRTNFPKNLHQKRRKLPQRKISWTSEPLSSFMKVRFFFKKIQFLLMIHQFCLPLSLFPLTSSLLITTDAHLSLPSTSQSEKPLSFYLPIYQNSASLFLSLHIQNPAGKISLFHTHTQKKEPSNLPSLPSSQSQTPIPTYQSQSPQSPLNPL